MKLAKFAVHHIFFLCFGLWLLGRWLRGLQWWRKQARKPLKGDNKSRCPGKAITQSFERERLVGSWGSLYLESRSSAWFHVLPVSDVPCCNTAHLYAHRGQGHFRKIFFFLSDGLHSFKNFKIISFAIIFPPEMIFSIFNQPPQKSPLGNDRTWC